MTSASNTTEMDADGSSSTINLWLLTCSLSSDINLLEGHCVGDRIFVLYSSARIRYNRKQLFDEAVDTAEDVKYWLLPRKLVYHNQKTAFKAHNNGTRVVNVNNNSFSRLYICRMFTKNYTQLVLSHTEKSTETLHFAQI